MKLYLASFFQTENHGPGRLISIAPNVPREIKGDAVFQPFAPPQVLIDKYKDEQLEDQVKASNNFVNSYKDQLKVFVEELKSSTNNPEEVLPFQDGDTLASWEREGFTNYRRILASFLEDLGYEVELH